MVMVRGMTFPKRSQSSWPITTHLSSSRPIRVHFAFKKGCFI